MRTTVTLALITTSVMARWGSSQDQSDFIQFVSLYNKDILDERTFIRKQRRFHLNDDFINQHNAKQMIGSVRDPDALILAHNWTSDLEPEEYQALLTLRVPDERKLDDHVLIDDRYDLDGRRLQNTDLPTDVDLFTAGHTGQIKDQGRCGSCWAFTANTTLEGTISKKKTIEKGEFEPPIHISEQQLIDCPLNGQTDYDFGGANYL